MREPASLISFFLGKKYLEIGIDKEKSIKFALQNNSNQPQYSKSTMAYVITDICVACGTCLPVCPVGAISEGEIYHIDPDTCIECGSCAEVCPTGAINPPA